MKFLMFAVAGNFSETPEVQGNEAAPFVAFLREKFTLPLPIANALAFAVAHCASPDEQTLLVLERMRGYLLSSGKYGNNPFLIGHYGGSGELAQGFCRVCAVHGGTYILGRQIQSIKNEAKDTSGVFDIQIEDLPEMLSSRVLISSPDRLPSSLVKEHLNETGQISLVRCIVILDVPISLSRQPTTLTVGESGNMSAPPTDLMDTYLLVFPPDSIAPHKHDRSVTALITGQGTMSCPSGKHILYLTTSASPDASPEMVLRPYLDEVLGFASPIPPQNRTKPLFEVFYRQGFQEHPESASDNLVLSRPDPPNSSTLTDSADNSAREAERIFRETIRVLRKSGADNEDEEEIDFWPPLQAHEKDEDDW
jgi:RAB protein geranylgeranyltransferase component A